MKKKILFLSKIFGLIFLYCFVLVISVFLTMSLLIKSDELEAPNFKGKSLKEAYELAAKKGIYLKKIEGTYDKNYDPLTVITQMPTAGIRIKEKSYIKVFVSSDVVEIIVPDLVGYTVADSEKLLREQDLKKRYVSYMDARDVPVDYVISQSLPPGILVPSGTEIDILASRGLRRKSYIMPNLIGEEAPAVLSFFENMGLEISKIEKVDYPGLEPDKVVKQHPRSGFRINAKARISIEVSK